MTFQEIKQKLIEEVKEERNQKRIKEIFDDYDLDAETESGNIYKFLFATTKLDKSVFGETIIVEEKKGSDYNDSYNIIKHFVDHNIYISLDGVNSSYNDIWFSDRNTLKEVLPKEKIVIVYEEK